MMLTCIMKSDCSIIIIRGMNYWGKVTNTLGNIAGNTQEAVTTELKKKDKEISALK